MLIAQSTIKTLHSFFFPTLDEYDKCSPLLLGMATGNSPSGYAFPSPSPRGGKFPVPVPANARGEFFFPSPCGELSPLGSPSPHQSSSIYTRSAVQHWPRRLTGTQLSLHTTKYEEHVTYSLQARVTTVHACYIQYIENASIPWLTIKNQNLQRFANVSQSESKVKMAGCYNRLATSWPLPPESRSRSFCYLHSMATVSRSGRSCYLRKMANDAWLLMGSHRRLPSPRSVIEDERVGSQSLVVAGSWKKWERKGLGISG
jgi:hypothetical protein